MAERIRSLGALTDRFDEGSLLILPLGAHEQHGPHLPFETDTIIAEGVSERVLARLGDAPVYALPAEPVGYSPEHMSYPGSRTLTYRDAVERWCAIGERAAARGIRRMLLLNAHGGNAPVTSIVAQELRVRADLFCVATSWTRFGNPAAIVGVEEKAFGIHAGDIETSVMLALAPERVDMSRAWRHANLQTELTERYDHIRAYGPHAFGWKMEDLSRSGVCGDAGAATAEKGRALLDEAVAGIVRLVEEMRRFDLGKLGRAPDIEAGAKEDRR